MKFGVFYHHAARAAEQQGVSLDEMMERIKTLGIDYVEMDQEVEKDPASAYELLKRHGLCASNVCYHYNFRTRPEAVKSLSQFRMAEALESPTVMPIPGLFSGNPDTREQELSEMMENMCFLAEEANRRGLNFCIEDFDNEMSPIADSKGMKYFLDRIPTLNVAFDTGNFYFVCEEAMEAFRVLKDRIQHVHLKDRADEPTDGQPKIRTNGVPMYPCAVGQGVIPIREIVSELEKSGYNGIYVMEFYDVADYWKAIRESAEYLNRLQEELG